MDFEPYLPLMYQIDKSEYRSVDELSKRSGIPHYKTKDMMHKLLGMRFLQYHQPYRRSLRKYRFSKYGWKNMIELYLGIEPILTK